MTDDQADEIINTIRQRSSDVAPRDYNSSYGQRETEPGPAIPEFEQIPESSAIDVTNKIVVVLSVCKDKYGVLYTKKDSPVLHACLDRIARGYIYRILPKRLL